jgi:hypothetical protein
VPLLAGLLTLPLVARLVARAAPIAGAPPPRSGSPRSHRPWSTHDCANCAFAYLVERKALLALRPSALLKVMRRG